MSDLNSQQEDDGNDTDFTDTYPADWPQNKRKYKPGTPRKWRFKRGESHQEYLKRRRKGIKAQYDKKRKEAKEERKKSGEVAMKLAMGEWTVDDNDPFVMLVAGQRNFEQDDPREKYKKCGAAVKLRLNIAQIVLKTHAERRKHCFEETQDWLIRFHVDPDRKVGEPGTVIRESEVNQLPLLSWLRVKKSTLPGAGLGLFAEREFEKGQIIGMYLGGKTGMPGYTIKPRWKDAELIHCHSFASADALSDQSARTMGLQMCNDPNFGLPNDAPKSPLWNVQIMKDLFVIATKNIEKGEELFADYRLTNDNEQEKNVQDDDDSSNSGDKEDNNEDNDNKDNESSSESESEKPKAKAKKTGDDSWTGESISSESELS